VCVRLPDGSRVSRMFRGDAAVADVRRWTATLGFDGAVEWTGEGESETVDGGKFTLLFPGDARPIDEEKTLSKFGKRVLFIVNK